MKDMITMAQQNCISRNSGTCYMLLDSAITGCYEFFRVWVPVDVWDRLMILIIYITLE